MIIFTNGDHSALTDEQYAEWQAGVAREWDSVEDAQMGSGPLCDSVDDTGHCSCDEECLYEGWFSWSRCEGCGSKLGGTRYNFPVWLPLNR
jgi:hypothetical protein